MARAKQGHLDGMEPPTIPEIDSAAEVYDKAMRKRQKLSQEEKDSKASLLEMMIKHNLTTYEWGKKRIVINAKSSVLIREKDDEDLEIDEEE